MVESGKSLGHVSCCPLMNVWFDAKDSAIVDDYRPGYGKVAAIEDLDADFLVFRKFGWLHNYALLYLQDELAQQQDELERFDKWEHEKGNPTKLVSRRIDQSFHDSRRKELVDKLHGTLTQYGEMHQQDHLSCADIAADELLLRMQKIQAIKRPTQRSQKNISNLILNTQNLVSDESDWIRHGPDLAALGCGAEYGWLNTSLEDALNKISKSMTMASTPTLQTSFQYLHAGQKLESQIPASGDPSALH